MKVQYRAQALADIERIHRYVHERSPQGALRVSSALRAAIENIAEQPEGSIRTDDPAIRMKVVQHHPYKIFYSIVDAVTVEIIHIRHTSRRPLPIER
jgi:plasmid stabilization system protein ParE